MYRIFKSFLLACLISTGVTAQKREQIKNLSNFENKTIHFGFSLGINKADFNLTSDLSLADSLISLEPLKQSGFNIAIVSDLHLSPNVSLRFVPGLTFTQRNLDYVFVTQANKRVNYNKPVESTYVDFPLNFKFRSNRYQNFAAFMIAGGNYSLDLISQEDVLNGANSKLAQIVVKTKKNVLSYQLGFGFDFFLEYFKFSPEFKWSMGIDNIHVPDGSILSNPIMNIQPKMFQLCFTFEG